MIWRAAGAHFLAPGPHTPPTPPPRTLQRRGGGGGAAPAPAVPPFSYLRQLALSLSDPRAVHLYNGADKPPWLAYCEGKWGEVCRAVFDFSLSSCMKNAVEGAVEKV